MLLFADGFDAYAATSDLTKKWIPGAPGAGKLGSLNACRSTRSC
jgi:hypothetical protein